MCFFQTKTPLTRSFVPHHALIMSFHVYKTPRYVTMSIYFLQYTFSVFLSSSPQHALIKMSSGCSMFSPLQKKVLQIGLFLSYAVNTSSVSAWCVNIQFLPCKSPWFSTLFRRKTRLKYAASCQSVFLPVFRPQFAHKSARKHAYLTLQTRQLCAAKAPKTHLFNAANIGLPERRPKTPVLRRKSTHKHACLTSKNDLQLIALSEPSLTKILALELIVKFIFITARF